MRLQILLEEEIVVQTDKKLAFDVFVPQTKTLSAMHTFLVAERSLTCRLCWCNVEQLRCNNRQVGYVATSKAPKLAWARFGVNTIERVAVVAKASKLIGDAQHELLVGEFRQVGVLLGVDSA